MILTVRMLPGTYILPLDVHFSTLKPLNIVATGAVISTIGDTRSITVRDGAAVEIRGLSSTSERHIDCGTTSGALSSLVIEDAVFTSVGNSPRGSVVRCALKLRNTSFAAAGGSLGILTDGSVDLDRVRFTNGAIDVINAARANVRITNSLLVETRIDHPFSADTGFPGTNFTFAYNTLTTAG